MNKFLKLIIKVSLLSSFIAILVGCGSNTEKAIDYVNDGDVKLSLDYENHVSFAYSSFLGFKKTENGIEIDEEQAKTVRLIYRLFLLEGMTTTGIAHYLNDLKIPTPRNGSKWLGNNIMSILKNEKYKGDALLQKKFTTDFLSHKMKENEGEIPQYYVHVMKQVAS